MLGDWLERYPKDALARAAKIQVERDLGRTESALSQLKILMKAEPENLKHLELAAELEASLSNESRSYLSPGAGKKKETPFLEKLLGKKDVNRTVVLRKIAQIHHKAQDYKTAVAYLAEAAQAARPEDRPDSIWMEAAGLALNRNDLSLAASCARNAVALNPSNASAKAIVAELKKIR